MSDALLSCRFGLIPARAPLHGSLPRLIPGALSPLSAVPDKIIDAAAGSISEALDAP